ncbi:peptide-methionine (R)-S-oxide reductase MsrB [Marinobacterium jannaschii]|uniref:peptide-methionine (R)-S-oxide reductase MsrB n=1 Tax=Marinobacterium jannaschii TaxID=64970 RepID=UPI000486089D|nr:peptide-methionine (R)-S-oxide reductase MsrB [Marinobacterium jannaschii]
MSESHNKVSKTDEEWQQQLSPEQFRICRRQGTERAFTGKYYDNKADGRYSCTCCGEPLFDSQTKYDSGSGWPSFWQPVAADVIEEHRDSTHGMERVEIRCARCSSHLGHVFPDGPQPTGLRYCVNSVSLNFEYESEEDKPE